MLLRVPPHRQPHPWTYELRVTIFRANCVSLKERMLLKGTKLTSFCIAKDGPLAASLSLSLLTWRILSESRHSRYLKSMFTFRVYFLLWIHFTMIHSFQSNFRSVLTVLKVTQAHESSLPCHWYGFFFHAMSDIRLQYLRATVRIVLKWPC